MATLNLLHLSDLHFGDDRTGVARAQRAQALDLLLQALPNQDYHALVISGDLTCKGNPAGYIELRTWLENKLFPRTGLAAQDCLICPGNHDLSRKAVKHLVKRADHAAHADELLDPEEPGFAPAFQAFIAFAQGLGIPAPTLLGQPNYLSGIREHRGLRFVCLNSAWFCRDSTTDSNHLWLGLPHLQVMPLLNDPRLYDEQPLTIALVHHPEDWFNASDKNDYGERIAAYRYLAERVHVILSGHTHGGVVNSTRKHDRAREILSGAGYDSHQYRNNFSILTIDPEARTLARHPWELDPRGPVWESKPVQRYSLRTENQQTVEPLANPSRYLVWLRDQTQLIPLQQLNLGLTEVPPPAIDILYVRLKAVPPAGRDLPERQEPVGLEPVGLEQALANPRLVIEGAPGGGKTTFVRWLAWMLCRPSGPPSDLPVQDRCPLFLRLSELDQHIAKTTGHGAPAVATDPRWLAHFFAAQGWGLDEAYFLKRFAQPDTLLLLDGLDEAATTPRRIQLVQLIAKAAGQFACRFVVTSRPGVHEGRATLTGFAVARIEELDPLGIEGFLRQWCQWLKPGPLADAYFDELRPAVSIAGIRHLARNPLMLTALAVLHFRRHKLPDQRAKLYEQILDWLAEQASERHAEYTKDYRLETFGHLALAMQSAPAGQILRTGIDDAAQLITPPGQSLEPARKFLEQAQVDSGIVTLRGGELVFWHRSFQEYLAARILLGFADADLHARARQFLYSAEGREVLPLLAARMAESGKGRLDALTASLIADALGQQTLERQAHAVGVLGNMLADAAPSQYEIANPQPWAELRAGVLCIFDKGYAARIGVKTRAAAAKALDQASQARLPTPDQAGYWIEIAGGTFTIGGDKKAHQALPAQRVQVKPFRIGKYPVTVCEYAKFLDSREGDTPEDTPKTWEDQLQHLSRPVTGVSWHDAQRYCAWSQTKLPTDEQWEFAARGVASRIYPWGKQPPDDSRANFNQNLGQPSPVGLFPDGGTPEGIQDMAGNVLEWTGSDFAEGSKSVRGAGFHYEAVDLRAAGRYWSGPVVRSDDLGFRCVRE